MVEMDLTDAVVSDPHLSNEVTLRRAGTVTNDNGYATSEPGEDEQIEAIVRPGGTSTLQIVVEGRARDESLPMLVEESYGVENDDRIRYRGDWFRALDKKVAPIDGYVRFTLRPFD